MRKLSTILAERERADLDDRDLRSRGDAGKERKGVESKLADLAEGLVDLSEKRLLQMNLPEGVADVVRDTRAISSAIARKRSLRRLRTALRAMDSDVVAARLTELVEVGIPRKPKLSDAQQEWARRLCADGDEALSEFVAAYPVADRQQLRQLARNANKPGPSQQRALTVLQHEVLRLTHVEALGTS
jgi:ribosome-associated protein